MNAELNWLLELGLVKQANEAEDSSKSESESETKSRPKSKSSFSFRDDLDLIRRLGGSYFRYTWNQARDAWDQHGKPALSEMESGLSSVGDSISKGVSSVGDSISKGVGDTSKWLYEGFAGKPENGLDPKSEYDARWYSKDNATPLTDWRKEYSGRIGRMVSDIGSAAGLPTLWNVAKGTASTAGSVLDTITRKSIDAGKGVANGLSNIVIAPLQGGRDNSILGWFTNGLEDLGEGIGGSLGDATAKMNTDPTKYHGDYAGVVDVLNKKEEAALYKREAKRLLRRARVAYRKKLVQEELANKAVRSPFI